MIVDFLRRQILLVTVLFASLFSFFWSGCEPKDKGIMTPNRPPVARLANIPVNDTASVPGNARRRGVKPVVSLYWVGNDPDGFVTAFMYRWSYKDSNNTNVVNYRPWVVLLNYVTYRNGNIIVLDLDTANNKNYYDAQKIAPEIFRFFANADLDPDKFDTTKSTYDTSLVHLFNDLDRGKTRVVKGVRVYASNPTNNQYPVHESPNKGTFVFESDDILNRHKFEIVAIDNEGTVSEQPDTVAFWTRIVEAPKVEFLTDGRPNAADSLYVLKQTTYTWPGIKFSYRGRDRNSRQLWFSWRVDSVKWSDWSTSTTAAVTASDMSPKRDYTGKHMFEVRCKNEFGKITVPDSIAKWDFVTVYPKFADPSYPRRVLLVIASKLNTAAHPNPWQPSTAQDSTYYKEIFDALGFIYQDATNSGKGYDIWNTETQPVQGISKLSHPALSALGRYTTVFLISDLGPLVNPINNNKMLIPSALYSKYLDAGGNMIWTGIFYTIPFQVIDAAAPLFTRFHLLSATFPDYITITRADFIGAFGSLGYPSYVELDSSKLDTTKNRWNGGLPLVAISSTTGFGEIIFRYDSRNDSIYKSPPAADIYIEKHSIGYLYRGITFKTAYYGIPLWFVKKDQAIEIVRRTFELFYP